jgi:hypothetical protein
MFRQTLKTCIIILSHFTGHVAIRFSLFEGKGTYYWLFSVLSAFFCDQNLYFFQVTGAAYPLTNVK